MSFIAWLIGSKLGRYLAMGLTALAAISIILLKVFMAGRNKEKLDQVQGQLKNLQEGIKVNEEINAMPHDARVNELRDFWSK